jgi:AcrR family transcriptional regulator
MDKTNKTRQRILKAAINIFATKGYHKTSVDEIVEVSATSKGAIYFHFPSKQEIFLGLVDEFATILESKITIAIDGEKRGVEKINAALFACIQTFGKYQKLTKIFLVQAVGLGVVYEEKRLQLHDRFVRLIKSHLDEAVIEGDIPPIDTEIAAFVWMGAINEIVIRWIYSGKPFPEHSLPTLRLILLRSIGISNEQIERLAIS